MRNRPAESARGIGQFKTLTFNRPSSRWFCKSFRKGKKRYVWKNNFVTIRQTGTMTIWPKSEGFILNKTKHGSRIDNFSNYKYK